MRFGWVAALVLVLATGCGSSEGKGSGDAFDDDLPPPPPASTPLPHYDPSTKAAAQKLLDRALDQLIESGSTSFKSEVEILGTRVTGIGGVDFVNESSESEFQVSGKYLEVVGGQASFEFRVIKTHVYGSPTFGPFDKCWFDYGDSNPLFAGSELPWVHTAVAAAVDAEPLGVADGTDAAVVVEIPAVELLGVSLPKLLNEVADQLSDQPIMSRAVIELRNGEYASLRFNIDEVLSALEDGGIDLVGPMKAAMGDDAEAIPPSKMSGFLRTYMRSTQTVTLRPGASVDVNAPPDDELMDASNITSTDPEGVEDPELCKAAG